MDELGRLRPKTKHPPPLSTIPIYVHERTSETLVIVLRKPRWLCMARRARSWTPSSHSPFRLGDAVFLGGVVGALVVSGSWFIIDPSKTHLNSEWFVRFVAVQGPFWMWGEAGAPSLPPSPLVFGPQWVSRPLEKWHEEEDRHKRVQNSTAATPKLYSSEQSHIQNKNMASNSKRNPREEFT